MDIIVNTNTDLFKEGSDMCQALEELMKDRFEEVRQTSEELGKELGKELGQKRANTLTLKLAENGRMEDIIKAARDSDYQDQLFNEFNL